MNANFLTVADLQTRFAVSPGTLRKYRRQGILPQPIHRQPLWDASQVEEAVKAAPRLRSQARAVDPTVHHLIRPLLVEPADEEAAARFADHLEAHGDADGAALLRRGSLLPVARTLTPEWHLLDVLRDLHALNERLPRLHTSVELLYDVILRAAAVGSITGYGNEHDRRRRFTRTILIHAVRHHGTGLIAIAVAEGWQTRRGALLGRTWPDAATDPQAWAAKRLENVATGRQLAMMHEALLDQQGNKCFIIA